MSQAYEPKRLPGDLDPLEGAPLPLAVPQRAIRSRDVPCRGEHETQSMLTRRHRVALRSIGDENTSLRCRFYVYVVYSDAGSAYRLEVLGSFDHLGRYLRRAPDDETVVSTDLLQKLLGAQAADDINLKFFLEKPDPTLGERLGYDNLQAVTPLLEKTLWAAPTPLPSSTR